MIYKNVEIIGQCDERGCTYALNNSKLSMSSFMVHLKGKSSLVILEKHANLKYKYGNRNLGLKGCYVSRIELKTKVVEGYIRKRRDDCR